MSAAIAAVRPSAEVASTFDVVAKLAIPANWRVGVEAAVTAVDNADVVHRRSRREVHQRGEDRAHRKSPVSDEDASSSAND